MIKKLLSVLFAFWLYAAAAFGAGFQDNFNRADSTDLGASWDAGYTAFDPHNLVGNAIRPTTLGTDSLESNTTSLGANQAASLTLKTVAGTTIKYFCVYLRLAAPATVTAYAFCATPLETGMTSRIFELVAGVSTNVVTENATTWASGDTLRAEADGTALRLYRNGALLLSGTNSTITSGGRTGIHLFVNTGGALSDAEADDFQSSDLAEYRLLLGVGA